MSNLFIDDMYIIFTRDKTTITKYPNVIDKNHLLIHIVPTSDRSNILSLKIKYYNSECNPSRINEEISDRDIFDSLYFSIINSEKSLLSKITSYIRSLPKEEVLVIINEYQNYIEDGIISDGFIAGIASYIAFIFLIDNIVFSQQLPFQVGIPTSVNFINKNMFQYLSMHFLAMTKITTDVVNQFISFIYTFINIWEPCFVEGPIISQQVHTKSYMDIITNISSNIITNNVQVQNSIAKINTDLNNLIIDTKTNINTLVSNIVPDVIIKEKIIKIIDEELSNKIQTNISKTNKDLLSQISKLHSEQKILSSQISKLQSGYKELSEKDSYTLDLIKSLRNDMSLISSEKNSLVSRNEESFLKLQDEISSLKSEKEIFYLKSENDFLKTMSGIEKEIFYLRSENDNLKSQLSIMSPISEQSKSIVSEQSPKIFDSPTSENFNSTVLEKSPEKFNSTVLEKSSEKFNFDNIKVFGRGRKEINKFCIES
jgi:hypothetical protein